MLQIHQPHSLISWYLSLSLSLQFLALVLFLTLFHHKYNHLQVSWIRHRDIHILTVGTYTYTTDQRFQTAFHRDFNEWTLQIKWAQKRDAGMYECQISTIPIKSFSVRLNVVGKWFQYKSLFSTFTCARTHSLYLYIYMYFIVKYLFVKSYCLMSIQITISWGVNTTYLLVLLTNFSFLFVYQHIAKQFHHLPISDYNSR